MSDELVAYTDAQLPHDAWQTLLTHSVLGGLCPLIPIPFLDDYVIGRLQARMYTKLFEAKGLELSADGARLLLEKDSALLGQALKSMALYPIKKLLGKLLYFLTIKTCAEVGSALLHEGWLLAATLEREIVPRDLLANEDIRALRTIRSATLETLESIDTSPINQSWTIALKQSRALTQSALESLSGFFRRDDTDVEGAVKAGGLQDVVDALEEDARQNDAYFQRLEATFVANLVKDRDP